MGKGLSYQRDPQGDNSLYATKILAKVKSGLKVWAQPAFSDIAKARRNLADRSLLVAQGTPVVNANYSQFKSNTNFLRTTLLETNEMTFTFLAKFPDTGADTAHQGVLGGSFRGAADPGVIIFFPNATDIRAQAYQTGNTNRPASLTVSGIENWKRYTAVITAGNQTTTWGAVTIYNETDNTNDTIAFTAARQPGIAPINIGSSRSVSFAGLADIAHVAIWNRALASQERIDHWAQVMAWANAKGIFEVPA